MSGEVGQQLTVHKSLLLNYSIMLVLKCSAISPFKSIYSFSVYTTRIYYE